MACWKILYSSLRLPLVGDFPAGHLWWHQRVATMFSGIMVFNMSPVRKLGGHPWGMVGQWVNLQNFTQQLAADIYDTCNHKLLQVIVISDYIDIYIYIHMQYIWSNLNKHTHIYIYIYKLLWLSVIVTCEEKSNISCAQLKEVKLNVQSGSRAVGPSSCQDLVYQSTTWAGSRSLFSLCEVPIVKISCFACSVGISGS